MNNKDLKIFPKVTIGILSWNRFYYLKATLESAKKCILYPNLEWIIIDNLSVEKGLKEYIKKQKGIDLKIFKKQTHADAMNELLKLSSGKYIIIWPEDIQFVKKGDWLKEIIEILENNKMLGSVGLNFLRKKTYHQIFSLKKWFLWRQILKEIFHFKFNFRFQKNLTSTNGFVIKTLGHVWPGVCGSGIPTITRKSIWQELGLWRSTETRNNKNLIDSSLGAEANMVKNFYSNAKPYQQGLLNNSVAADIITDPIGSKAKVRGNKRYGLYSLPKRKPFYYEISTLEKKDYIKNKFPQNFEENIISTGIKIPLDKDGNLIKAQSINYNIVENINKL